MLYFSYVVVWRQKVFEPSKKKKREAAHIKARGQKVTSIQKWPRGGFDRTVPLSMKRNRRKKKKKKTRGLKNKICWPNVPETYIFQTISKLCGKNVTTLTPPPFSSKFSFLFFLRPFLNLAIANELVLDRKCNRSRTPPKWSVHRTWKKEKVSAIDRCTGNLYARVVWFILFLASWLWNWSTTSQCVSDRQAVWLISWASTKERKDKFNGSECQPLWIQVYVCTHIQTWTRWKVQCVWLSKSGGLTTNFYLPPSVKQKNICFNFLSLIV